MEKVMGVTNILTKEYEDNLSLLTADEVAAMLMVGKNRVYELLNTKKIKGMRIGTSSWRIPKLAVYQYIQEQTQL